MTTLWLGLVVVLATRWLTAHTAAPYVRYRAAVYEHVVQLPLPPASQRTGAVHQMQRNLDVYRQQAAAAKAQGAQLVVFPEDGIYGMELSRDQIRPFLETVPDPRSGSVNPCEQRLPGTEVQTALSCMARDLGIHVVANMGDSQPCQAFPKSPCPRDNVWQFNTGVAFGPDGRLLARYHKVNLYGETQFNTPPSDPYNDAVIFNTTFGVRFGLATCFDLLFRTPPVDLVEKHGVRDLTFPTAWMDVTPMLPAVGYHSSFARGLGVTVLAANIHLPLYRMHGSGIYGAHGATAFYSNADLSSSGRLVVADVLSDGTIRPLPPLDSSGNHPVGRQAPMLSETDASPQGTDTGSSSLSMIGNVRNSIFYGESVRDKLFHTRVPSRQAAVEEHFRKKSSKKSSHSIHLNYVRKADAKNPPIHLFDNFTFTPLPFPSGHRELCWQDFCCSVDFKFMGVSGQSSARHFQLRSVNVVDRTRTGTEQYALGVFVGYEGDLGIRRYVQVCLVTRCPDGTMDSCGEPVSTATSRLESLHLQGNFSTRYVYPELLVDQGGQLSPAPGLWDFTSGAIVGTARLSENPFIATALYGRWYDKDVPPTF